MRKLLIVEDEIIIAEGVKTYMEKNGYTVEIATTSEKAIGFLQQNSFDAIICDINLQEEKTGIDIIKRHHLLKKHGPVIFLTAYSNAEVMESAESLLPYAYILKPFYNKQLLTTLNLAIANSHVDNSENLAMNPELKENLSPREKEILSYLVYGKTNKEIGETLFISKLTVDTHVRNIKEKLGMRKKGELIKFVLLHNVG